ncbi:GTP-binding protein [Oxalobacteraceae bacterium CAVE-383]|nr:GTP-binding protein [Oxalobacteraceae bacterium CAVE-383]
MDKRIPVTVLTGDPGVGKTALRHRILSEDSARRYALVVDRADACGASADALVVHTEEELFEMNSGCICCTIRGDLIRALHTLLMEQSGKFDAVIIETAGSADPGPIIQTFFIDHILEQRTRLDAIVAVAGADTIVRNLRDQRHAVQQIAFADQIVLNNAAAMDGTALAAVEARLRGVNPLAVIHRAQAADIAIERLLERGAFELERGAALPSDFLMPEQHAGDGSDGDVRAFSLRSDVPMAFERIDEWLAALVMGRGADILRGKGIVDVVDAGGEHRRLAFQSVQMLHEGNFPRPWAAGERRASQVVFIGRNLDRMALQTGFMSCAAAGVENFALVAAA